MGGINTALALQNKYHHLKFIERKERNYFKGQPSLLEKEESFSYRTWNLPFNKTLNPYIYYLKVFIFAFPISIFVKSVLTIGNDMIKYFIIKYSSWSWSWSLLT